MNVHLGKLPAGHWRYLTAEEMTMINRMIADSSKTEEASALPRSPKPALKKENSDKEITPEEYLRTLDAEKTRTKKTQSFKDFRKAGRKK